MKTLKSIMSAVLITAALLSFPNGNEASAAKNEKPVSVFYVPHPDDEMLTMGVALFNHVWKGSSEVHVVLLSHGGASGVYNVLTGERKSRLLNRYVDPVKEGYAPFTIEDFKEARVNEFKYSVSILGVKPENIHIMDLGDGNITKDEMKEVIMSFENKYNDVRHKTMSWDDNHPDHANGGKALLELYKEGKVKDARFYAKNSQALETPEDFSMKLYKEKYTDDYYPYINAAIASYSRWSPESGHFGVGYNSVPGSFELLRKNPVSYYHLPK